jgi:hypothetical protein
MRDLEKGKTALEAGFGAQKIGSRLWCPAPLRSKEKIMNL